MQMIDTKNITSSAQLIKNYADVRKRLFNRKPAKQTPEMPKALRIDPERRGKRPLWCLVDIRFDEHEKTFLALRREDLRRKEKAREIARLQRSRPGKIVILPMWQLTPTYFNDHVVKHLRHKLAIEGDEPPEVVKQAKPVRMIVAEVIQHFPGIEVEHLRGATRVKAYIIPRHLAMWEVKRQRPDMSIPAVGRWFGDRDHTTVIHACRKIDRMKEEGELDWYFEAKERIGLTGDDC